MGYDVLIVDDDHTNLMITQALLEKSGYSVGVCLGGCEAVVTYQRNPCNLILMDLMMPEMDGFRATESIRTVERQKLLKPAHIIGFSSFTHNEFRDKCSSSGLNEFLPKPCEHDKLLSSVRAALSY